jgi:putative lipase involved disintegration of autophagic bodies
MFLYFIINITQCFLTYTNIVDFATLSYNVYYNINSPSWVNTTFQNVIDISIKNNSVKSYLFTNKDRTKSIISFKGTSIYWQPMYIKNNQSTQDICLNDNVYDNVYDTLSSVSNDKYNDNLYYSCCFYKQSSAYECNCENPDNNLKNVKTCCKDCYKNSINFELNYINEIKLILQNAKQYIDFEKNTVYFTGHSLGGTLAIIASILYNKKAITFHSPGFKHYINLINLGYNINYDNIYNFGNNADPLFIGNCGSLCYLFGYNIDTKCHIGNTCIYDAKTKLGYTESILNHRIERILNDVIPHWEHDLPDCFIDKDCIDCENWIYN